jgi:hypothetical protein
VTKIVEESGGVVFATSNRIPHEQATIILSLRRLFNFDWELMRGEKRASKLHDVEDENLAWRRGR